MLRFNIMPIKNITQVFTHLELTDLRKLPLVCKRWLRACYAMIDVIACKSMSAICQTLVTEVKFSQIPHVLPDTGTGYGIILFANYCFESNFLNGAARDWVRIWKIGCGLMIEGKIVGSHMVGTWWLPQARYVGEIQNFAITGTGILYKPEYVAGGNFVDGVLQGSADIMYANGDEYHGGFLDGSPNGSCNFILDGMQFCGYLAGDTARGKLEVAGWCITGTFINMVPSGEVVMTNEHLTIKCNFFKGLVEGQVQIYSSEAIHTLICKAGIVVSDEHYGWVFSTRADKININVPNI